MRGIVLESVIGFGKSKVVACIEWRKGLAMTMVADDGFACCARRQHIWRDSPLNLIFIFLHYRRYAYFYFIQGREVDSIRDRRPGETG